MASLHKTYDEEDLTIERIGEIQKGLYHHIREAFTDQAAIQSQTIGYATSLFAGSNSTLTDEDQEGQSNYFVRRQYGAANWETGSLNQKLGFENKKYPIGKFADGKIISEAIVVIPYLEEPINIKIKGKSYYENQDFILNTSQGTPTFPGGEIYSTREIIPGKHFLPVHKTLFENILSVMLVDRLYEPGDKQYQNILGDGLTPGQHKTQIAEAKGSDVGKMINL